MVYYLYYPAARSVQHVPFGYIDTNTRKWDFASRLSRLIPRSVHLPAIPEVWRLKASSLDDIIHHPDVVILDVSTDEEFAQQYPEYQI